MLTTWPTRSPAVQSPHGDVSSHSSAGAAATFAANASGRAADSGRKSHSRRALLFSPNSVPRARQAMRSGREDVGRAVAVIRPAGIVCTSSAPFSSVAGMRGDVLEARHEASRVLLGGTRRETYARPGPDDGSGEPELPTTSGSTSSKPLRVSTMASGVAWRRVRRSRAPAGSGRSPVGPSSPRTVPRSSSPRSWPVGTSRESSLGACTPVTTALDPRSSNGAGSDRASGSRSNGRRRSGRSRSWRPPRRRAAPSIDGVPVSPYIQRIPRRSAPI